MISKSNNNICQYASCTSQQNVFFYFDLRYLLTLLMFILSFCSFAQDLKRISSKGVQFKPLSDEELSSMSLKAGMLVVKVIPGFTADKIGIKNGDIVISINN